MPYTIIVSNLYLLSGVILSRERQREGGEEKKREREEGGQYTESISSKIHSRLSDNTNFFSFA